MTIRRHHYVLVEIGFPSGVPTELAAEMVEAAIQEAIDDGKLMIVHGNGPNPPYEGSPDLLIVHPDERP